MLTWITEEPRRQVGVGLIINPVPPPGLPPELVTQLAGFLASGNFAMLFKLAQDVAAAGFGPFAHQLLNFAVAQGAKPFPGVCDNVPGLNQIPGVTPAFVEKVVNVLLNVTDTTQLRSLAALLKSMGGGAMTANLVEKKADALDSGAAGKTSLDEVLKTLCDPTVISAAPAAPVAPAPEPQPTTEPPTPSPTPEALVPPKVPEPVAAKGSPWLAIVLITFGLGAAVYFGRPGA